MFLDFFYGMCFLILFYLMNSMDLLTIWIRYCFTDHLNSLFFSHYPPSPPWFYLSPSTRSTYSVLKNFLPSLPLIFIPTPLSIRHSRSRHFDLIKLRNWEYKNFARNMKGISHVFFLLNKKGFYGFAMASFRAGFLDIFIVFRSRLEAPVYNL